MVSNLKQTVIGNIKQTHSITTAIVDITKTTKQISKDYELLTKKSWNLDKELNQFKYYLQASHKMRVMCHDSHLLADNLLEEAIIMKDVLVSQTA